MLIGILALVSVIGLIAHAMWTANDVFLATTTKELREQLFHSIGYWLAAAAVVELAYTLFTHGPDEAIDPLILALSAALLLVLGKADASPLPSLTAVFVGSLAMAVLFWIRARQVPGPQHQEEPRRAQPPDPPPDEVEPGSATPLT